MALFVGPCGPFGGPVRKPFRVIFALVLGLATVAVSGNAPAADIRVVVDQARVLNLPDKVVTIVIGNPMIADATLQSGGLTIITGKSYGTTNFIALDRSGAVLVETLIQVDATNTDTVVVYRGTNRETYRCAPACEPRIMLGDSQTHYQSTTGQAKAHSDFAHGNASPK